MVLPYCLSGWWRAVLPSFLLGLGCIYPFSNRGCQLNLAHLQTCRERKPSPSALITKVITKQYRVGMIRKGQSVCGHRKYTECSAHRLSADRMVNGRLLLLLQFSSANFFPMVVLVLLLSSWLSGILGFPKTFDGSVGFLVPVETSVAGGGAWKNLCRADWVFWAEAVQDWEGGIGLTGFTTMFSGADKTEEGRGAGWVWLTPFNRPAELAGPFLIPCAAGEGLQLFWWVLQIEVSGSFPGLWPPAWSTLEHSLHLLDVH